MAQQYMLDQKPTESLQQYYKRLAKTADQRLVRLEKASQEEFYKPAKEWAYAKAQRDIRKWLPAGQEEPAVLRFNTKIPGLDKLKPEQANEKLIAKINDIKSFLAAPTSTKQGITNVYKKRADTLNKNYGTKFTWKQMAQYYESGQADLWDAKYGSKTALHTIAYIQKHRDEIKAAINQTDKTNIKISGTDGVIKRRVIKMLQNNELQLSDLY